MTVKLTEISKLLGGDESKADRHFFGQVQSINADGTYNVTFDGESTVKCSRLVGARVGDTVFVCLMQNGHAVVTHTVGGDRDALDYLYYNANEGLYISDNVQTLDNAVKIDSEGMSVIADGNERARFEDDKIELGKGNSNSLIYLCNTDNKLSYQEDTRYEPQGDFYITSKALALNVPKSDSPYLEKYTGIYSGDYQPPESGIAYGTTGYIYSKSYDYTDDGKRVLRSHIDLRCASDSNGGDQATAGLSAMSRVFGDNGEGNLTLYGDTVQILAFKNGVNTWGPFYSNGVPVLACETGTSNGWKYQKWENGDMFAWMTVTNSGSVSFTSATGGGYTTLSSRNLPSGFISAPSVFATANTTTSAWLTLTPYNVTTTSFTPRLARHFSNNAISAGALIMNYYAVGTWK